MLRGTYLTQMTRNTTLLSVFLFALLVAAGVMFLWLWLSPVLTLGLLALFYMIAFRRFDQQQVMNLVYPALGALVAYMAALALKYFTELRERRRVTSVFGRYVAPDVVEEVLAAPAKAVATLKGASRQLTMLFADLRGFTAASENSSPEEVVEALNVYLDAMTRAVLEEKGTIDKFMGDCVMAFWGAPKEEPRHAEKAIRAAMRMQDLIDEAMADPTSAASHLKVKGCGVGIASGEAVVGNIGSVDRLDYTVIGDTVNTASRLCGVAGSGEIVCTDETAYRVALLGVDIRLGELPPLVVKGKVEPLKVYQVLREGQEAVQVKEGELTVMVEEKGHFEEVTVPTNGEAEGVAVSTADEPEPVGVQQAPPKVAGYAPVEPAPKQPGRED
jgi:adenylate cyclase